MKFKVGDLVKWDGHDARIGAIMEHPSRYIIEYTVRQSDVSGRITHAYGRTKIVKEEEIVSVGDDAAITTEEQRSYNLRRPPHLIAGQVIRDIEAIAMVKFGSQSSGPIHRLVEQYQQLLFERDQKNAELEYQRDWVSLMKEFEGLLIAYLESREQDSDDGDSDDDLAIVAWEKLKNFFRRHVGTNAQGVPKSIVDAYERYLKANDDESSDNEFRNARMALIDAVGGVVNSQGEVKS